MNNGNYTIYILQCRWSAQSPWLEPDKPLEETPNNKWLEASRDFFGQQTDHEVWCETGYNGWWNLENARKELSRIRDRDEHGDYDSVDSYKKKCQAVRHQFRIVKLELSKKTTLV